MSSRPIRLTAVSSVSVSLEQALADDIRQEWQPVLDAGPSLVRAIIATGERLIDAREQVKREAWLSLFHHTASCAAGCCHVENPLPFGVRQAQRLMQVARNPVLSDAYYNTYLPSNTDCLASLAHLPESKLIEAIKSGAVSPTMTREQAAELREPRPASDCEASKEAIGPQSRPCDDDSIVFFRLRDKLCHRWVTPGDRAVMRQTFQQLKNEVEP